LRLTLLAAAVQILLHMACVALHIDGFKCCFEALCRDVGSSADDLAEKFRLLGCRVSRNVAVLRLPAAWPLSRKKARS
jgi:hypothetical protein